MQCTRIRILHKTLQHAVFRQHGHRPTLQMNINSYIDVLSFERNFVTLLSHKLLYIWFDFDLLLQNNQIFGSFFLGMPFPATAKRGASLPIELGVAFVL